MRFKKKFAGIIIISVAMMTIIGLSDLIFVIPNEKETSRQNFKMEKIYLKTEDGVKVTAIYRKVENPRDWVVLTHMMPAAKESWNDFTNFLEAGNYSSIAIDLRGHGESNGGPEGFLKFSDSEHQKSILDLKAAVDFLKKDGATPEKIIFIGASIGANLSLQILNENPQYKTAILLSAGLNYRGIKTEPMIKNLKAGQRVFLISAEDDGFNSDENRKLYNLAPSDIIKKIQIYPVGGHGTNIFESQPELKQLILNFIKQ